MNILIINHYAGSLSLGMKFRTYYLARQWQSMGHSVTIVAADYSHLRQVNPAAAEAVQAKRIDGLNYLFVRTPEYSGNGLQRVRNILFFLNGIMRAAKRVAKGICPDIVIAASGYPMDIYPAQKIAEMCGARLIWELHDIYPDSLSLQHLPAIAAKISKFLINAAVDYACVKSSAIVSVLSHAEIFLCRCRYSQQALQKLAYIPDGVDASESYGAGDVSAYCRVLMNTIEEMKTNGKFVVMYLGNFAMTDSLDEFIWAAKLIKNTAFVLIGNGIDRARLRKLAGQEGLTQEGKVYFFDAVDKKDVQPLLGCAGCLYAGLRKNELHRYGIEMGLLYEYMLSARPIICGIDTPFNVISESGCGAVIPPEDSAAIAAAISELAALPESVREKTGMRGRDYVIEHNTWKLLAEKFLDVAVSAPVVAKRGKT